MASPPISGGASSTRFSRLDADLQRRAHEGEFSGVVVVGQRGKPELARAYGDGITLDTCFNLASASKMFTLVAVEQLLEAGKLRRDDRLGMYVTNYPAAADVTIGQLLAHTGGLPAGVTPDFFGAIETKHSLDEMIAAVGAPLDFAPGSRKQYSNIGFLLLGRVVEVASTESFERYVTRHIVDALGMANTSAQATGCAPPMTRGMLTPESAPAVVPRRPFVPPRATPAGGWVSSANDMFLFSQALQDRRIVSAAPGSLGLGERAWGSNRMVGHNGGAPGMNAEFWILNDADTVIVLSNFDPPAATRVMEEIATVITGTSPPPVGGKVRIRKP
jgi:CubicO group peptidase (beta-lactamase class C family)